jgi:hypothetical protein
MYQLIYPFNPSDSALVLVSYMIKIFPLCMKIKISLLCVQVGATRSYSTALEFTHLHPIHLKSILILSAHLYLDYNLFSWGLLVRVYKHL